MLVHQLQNPYNQAICFKNDDSIEVVRCKIDKALFDTLQKEARECLTFTSSPKIGKIYADLSSDDNFMLTFTTGLRTKKIDFIVGMHWIEMINNFSVGLSDGETIKAKKINQLNSL